MASNDSLQLETVKDIDIKTKQCVYEYVKDIQSLLPHDNVYFTIPTLVIYWIILYYHIQIVEKNWWRKPCYGSFEMSLSI